MHVDISLKLNIIPGPNGGKVMVPGREPTSALTSTRLDYEINRMGMVAAMVDVADVLAAVPGSYVDTFDNASGSPTSGFGRKILVFPPRNQTCPCSEQVDYYAILVELGREVSGEELNELLGCDAFSVDQCAIKNEQSEWRSK